MKCNHAQMKYANYYLNSFFCELFMLKVIVLKIGIMLQNCCHSFLSEYLNSIFDQLSVILFNHIGSIQLCSIHESYDQLPIG